MADEASDKDKAAPAKNEQKETKDLPAKDAETVTLVPTGLPFLVSSLVLPQEDGSMLSFDMNGTEVPAEDADQHIEAALAAGVALTRKA